MEVPKIFESEYKLCLILWDNEPISISNLAKLANSSLGWNVLPPTPELNTFTTVVCS